MIAYAGYINNYYTISSVSLTNAADQDGRPLSLIELNYSNTKWPINLVKDHLICIKFSIEALLLEQFGMRSTLQNLTILQNHNLVSRQNCL